MRKIILFFALLLVRCYGCKEKLSSNPQQTNQDAISENLVQAGSHQPKDGLLILQESQNLAKDLRQADNLAAKYQTIKNKFPAEAGSHTHATFVGIEGIKKALRKRATLGEGDLGKFILWTKNNDWKQFGPNYHHYDWWMFPLDQKSSGQGWQFTVYQQDIQALKSDPIFLEDYRLGAILLLQSWGWDVKNNCPYAYPAPGQQWRNWDVRLGKLGHSLILFEQWDLYESLKAYVAYLSYNNIQLDNRTRSFFAD